MPRRAASLALLLSLTSCLAPSRSANTQTAERPRWLSLRTPRTPPPTAPSGDAGAALATAADAGPASVPRCPEGGVYVPAATFQMGDANGSSDERPPHAVTLSAFCVDRTEVTADAYTACVTQGACTRPSGSQPSGDRAVTGVDWEQANSYCRYVGGRLPTEAEWELAARGTDGRLYPWGNTAPTGCEQLDWSAPDGPCRGVGPSAVGSSPSGASPFGALDMAGNVWEWTSDWYAPAYTAGAQTNPTGPATGSARVTRGGGWNNDQPERLRATWREGQHPAFHDYDLGVRCAYVPGV